MQAFVAEPKIPLTIAFELDGGYRLSLHVSHCTFSDLKIVVFLGPATGRENEMLPWLKWQLPLFWTKFQGTGFYFQSLAKTAEHTPVHCGHCKPAKEAKGLKMTSLHTLHVFFPESVERSSHDSDIGSPDVFPHVILCSKALEMSLRTSQSNASQWCTRRSRNFVLYHERRLFGKDFTWCSRGQRVMGFSDTFHAILQEASVRFAEHVEALTSAFEDLDEPTI